MKLSKRICKRVLSLFLAVALAVSAVAYRPPKAEAIAVVDDIAVVVAVFVAACGLTWIVKNQSGGDFTAAVQQLVTTYAGSLGETYAEWCARVSYSLSAGHLIFGKGVVSVLSDFAHWLIDTYGVQASQTVFVQGGEDVMYFSGTFHNGHPDAVLCDIPINYGSYSFVFSDYTYPATIVLSKVNKAYLYITQNSSGNHIIDFYWNGTQTSNSTVVYSSIVRFSSWWYVGDSGIQALYRTEYNASGVPWSGSTNISTDMLSYVNSMYTNIVNSNANAVQQTDSYLAVEAATAIDVPDSASINDDQSVSVDTGVSASTDDDTLQQILDAIIANNLAVTQDVVTPSDTDLTWTDTLWGWLTGIKDAIIGLPARIADAVKALFIPDEAFFDTAVADLQTTFQGRMGLLTYPMSVLYNFTDRVMNIQDQEPILRWDTVNFMDHQLIPAGQYNLNDGLQTPALKTAHDIYFIVVNAVMILAFLDLCWKKYREVTHN